MNRGGESGSQKREETPMRRINGEDVSEETLLNRQIAADLHLLTWPVRVARAALVIAAMVYVVRGIARFLRRKFGHR